MIFSSEHLCVTLILARHKLGNERRTAASTLLLNNEEGMTKLFFMESIDNFLTNLIHKYYTMCKISVCFIKIDVHK